MWVLWWKCDSSFCDSHVYTRGFLALNSNPSDRPRVLHPFGPHVCCSGFLSPMISLGASFCKPTSEDRWFGVSAVDTALFFPPLQLLPPPCLLFTHAVPEGLHLWLALSPVLVLGHALLHCIVGSSTARAGDQLVQWVLFLTLLLHLLGPGMALSWHL